MKGGDFDKPKQLNGFVTVTPNSIALLPILQVSHKTKRHFELSKKFCNFFIMCLFIIVMQKKKKKTFMCLFIIVPSNIIHCIYFSYFIVQNYGMCLVRCFGNSKLCFTMATPRIFFTNAHFKAKISICNSVSKCTIVNNWFTSVQLANFGKFGPISILLCSLVHLFHFNLISPVRST